MLSVSPVSPSPLDNHYTDQIQQHTWEINLSDFPYGEVDRGNHKGFFSASEDDNILSVKVWSELG